MPEHLNQVSLAHAMSRTRFDDWLSKKPAQSDIGTAADGCHCPIAVYLSQQFPSPSDPSRFKVTPSRIEVGQRWAGTYIAVVTPNWAISFITIVDGTYSAGPSSTVRAEDALRILRAIPEKVY